MTFSRNLAYSSIFISLLTSLGCWKKLDEGRNHSVSLPEQVDYNFHVKPLLSDRCYACHGPDEKTREAGLRLDTKDAAFAALKEGEGFAIKAGSSTESELIHRIYSDDPEMLMPPPESELVLNESEKALLKKWIEQGAEWKSHWAFLAPEAPELPRARNSDWARNEIDYFILQKQQEQGLRPAEEAPKTQWLRRVSFDITGLPPKPEAVAAFLADESENAYEQVVNRLLDSPAYGERMASLWLDVARYADSHGYQDDRPRTMWPWRDWVIKAFNENLPYDDFVTWQLAGDLLPDPSYEQKLATAFNRNHAITQEGGVVQEEYMTEYAADRVNTFSTAFLGLTIECARCHTHKYDPISQSEYYSLMGFFNNINERGQISYFDKAPTPNMPIQDAVREAQVEEVRQWIVKKESELSELKATYSPSKKAVEQDEINLTSGLLTQFSLDKQEADKVFPELADRPLGRMNINLPDNIPMPKAVTGKSGEALEFDGDNFLSLGEIGDFEWYDAFSYGGWVRHSNQHEKNAGIFSRRVGEQKRQGYDLVLTPDNRLAARIIHHYIPDRGLNLALDVQTYTHVSPQTWHHVFVTYDGRGKAEGLSIYLDGEKQELNIVMDSLDRHTIANGNDFLVGHWNHRARNLSDLYGFEGGRVDEVFLYNRVLSPIEVNALYGEGKSVGNKAIKEHHLLMSEKYRTLKYEIDSLNRIDQEDLAIMIMEELDTVKTTFRLERGAYDAQAEQVERGTPQAVMGFGEHFPQNRLGLAQWLFSPEHPLSSRVMVNRFWQVFFGAGLVSTPEDFGNQGSFPTHPELLDWLAVNFRVTDWDMKRLVKKIVLSATYRQDASFRARSASRDPDNTWLSRGPSKRLAAEMLRDQALFASGLYYEKVGGKWVKPYQPAGIWKELANQIGENKYRVSQGKDLYRRSLYSYWKRTIPPPTMLTFDASERAVCTVKRQETSTPLQALILLNSPVYLEASRKLAESLLLKKESFEECLHQAFLLILSRTPQPQEISILKSLYEAEHQRFQANPIEAQGLLAVGASPYSADISAESLAAMSVVVNTLFNMDEAKYR